jgi:indole-3-glycerol phosphate synthase
MTTYLDRILERHREVAALDRRPIEAMRDQVSAMPPTRGFREMLASASIERLAVISEIKRRSPSKGDLNVGLSASDLARSYAEGGASCLSVLTDVEFFGGSVDDLRAARAACHLPVLRKDFTVGVRDVLDARSMGADCVLLIAAALSAQELVELHGEARTIGLDVLVEIHDESELEHAVAAGADLIGVNQRDLITFEVDHERAVRMAALIPDTAIKVAESGVRGSDDARSLRAAGYHAVLVGETLVTAPDPVAALEALRVP